MPLCTVVRLPPVGLLPLLASLALSASAAATTERQVCQRFDFGTGRVASDWVAVRVDTTYTTDRGFGLEPGATVVGIDRATGHPERSDFLTSDRPFHFTARVAGDGNYRVSVTLGDAEAATHATIKAELRRLVIEAVHTNPGELKTVSFIVNVRTPQIAAGPGVPAGAVKLKAPRETVQEAWAWDDAITLEFSNRRPAVCAVVIEPVNVPTVFLLGDSTVCDQSKEPYASWGQMLPAFFKSTVAIANHGESGETYRDSLRRRRLDKVVSSLRPGDWVLLQFGHNDQKQIAAGTGGPATTYKAEIRQHVEAIRAHGGTPVLLSPMERRGFEADGRVMPSLIAYADAAREAARELGVAFIDLNAASRRFYEALGPERSAAAFAAPNGVIDNTHHNNYGAYELAKCIVQAIRDQHLPLAAHLNEGWTPFDPAHPDDPTTFAVPASGAFTNERPLGD